MQVRRERKRGGEREREGEGENERKGECKHSLLMQKALAVNEVCYMCFKAKSEGEQSHIVLIRRLYAIMSILLISASVCIQ